jgi:hypothetical protein
MPCHAGGNNNNNDNKNKISLPWLHVLRGSEKENV